MVTVFVDKWSVDVGLDYSVSDYQYFCDVKTKPVRYMAGSSNSPQATDLNYQIQAKYHKKYQTKHQRLHPAYTFHKSEADEMLK